MESQESQQRVSYLAFNINPAEGGNSSSFEGGTSFTRQQSHYSVVALFEKFRCRVIENESSRFVVVLKSKLFSDKSDLHVRLVAVTRLACRHKRFGSRRLTICTLQQVPLVVLVLQTYP
jgi:hypothetical protein